ncbi:InlB B-repeat-containing protein [Paludibaculum fermentans]|uniref:InlB B-repeat-containing protein n=1 Tax=Paludibaculum fermentans TaxID=1473598 RepID=UPI003EC0B819
MPSTLSATISASNLTILNGQPTTAGYVMEAPLSVLLRNAAGDADVNSPTGAEFPNCTTVTKQRFANLRFSEQMGFEFQPPNWKYDLTTGAKGTPQSQATLGWIYQSESGFYNADFPSVNNLNKAGLADSGTRLQATFSGLPSGATIYVSTVAMTYTNGVPVPNPDGVEQARLTGSAAGAFAPVAATDTLDGIPVAALAITQGNASAVWEILSGNGSSVPGNIDIPVWISFPGNGVGVGTAHVTMGFAPVSTITTNSETAPIPRFTAQSQTLPLLTILDSCPASQYLVTTSPAFLPIVVDGQPYTSPKSFPWQPGTTHTVSVANAVAAGNGTRQLFLGWNDAGALSHTIAVPPSPTAYVASFKTQFLLDLKILPTAGGTVTLTPPTSDGYYDPQTKVEISASPNPLYGFAGYSGDISETLNSTSLKLSTPRSVTVTFVRAGPVSSTVGVTPASGAGSYRSFQAVYEGSQGAGSLTWVQLLFAAAPDGGGQPFCFVHYDVKAGQMWLYSDVYGFFAGPVAPGQNSAALQGSSCAVEPTYSRVSLDGAWLTFEPFLLFKVPGAKRVYLRERDDAGVDSGWVQRGTWDQQAVGSPVTFINPATSEGTGTYFELNFTTMPAPALYSAPLGWKQFLIAADSDGGGQPFCFVHYDTAAGQFWMYSSDVGFFIGPVAPGSASTALDTSACTLYTAGATYTNSLYTQILSLPIELKAPMKGVKKLYTRYLDPLMTDSGFVEMGWYRIP